MRSTQRKRWATVCALALGCIAGGLGAADSTATVPSTQKAAAGAMFVYRVPARNDANATADRLAALGFDIVEGRHGSGDLLVVGDAATATQLRRNGFGAIVHETIGAETASAGGLQPQAITFYGGYKDAPSQYAHFDAVVAAYPTLAQVVDYGDSHLKSSGLGGHDLKAICLTNRQPGDCAVSPTSVKPRFVIMSQIHARELTTGELMYRWIDELTTKYGTDADITVLLNSTEVWIIPTVNPDGIDIVDSASPPLLHRKNAHNEGGACAVPSTSSSHHGVDLNRNSSFKYGGSGTSVNKCDQTYRGVGAASEPEIAALQALLLNLFPDQRGPLDTDVAPESTVGTFVTVHSYSNFVLLPWSWTNANAPNDAALRHIAFRMSYYNGYKTGRGGEILYTASGVTDDYVYGTLGVPGFTFEVGPTSGACSGFTPAFSCQDSTFWPLNRPAFLYGAKLARQPYTLGRGPSSRNVTVSASTVAAGGSVTLNATADDNALGNASGSFGRPARQNINRAEYCVDVAPWAGCTPIAMAAVDGNLNSATEAVRATVNTTGWAPGKHTIYVRSRDTSNYWGPYSAVFLTVT
jgi:carboxypeptidase T